MRDPSLIDFLIPIFSHNTGDLHHGFRVKVLDRAAVRHDQQHFFLGVKCQGSGQSDDVGGMAVHLKAAIFRGSLLDDIPGGGEHGLLPAIHDLVCPCVIGICVGHHIVWIEIIF